MSRRLLILLLTLAAPAAFGILDGTGLQTSVSADIVGQFGLENNSGATERLDVRGAEFMFYAPADHLFDGAISFAAHAEGGIPTPELHEAWIGSTKLIPRSRFRLGQFFLSVGRLNQFHQHDWPFVTAPRVQNEFFAFEGILDMGLEYSYLLPLPFFLEVTGGLTNGRTFGHDHAPDPPKPLVPTHYLRAATYTSLPWNGGMQVGLNYIGNTSGGGIRRSQFGLDVTAKWREAKMLQFLLQSEIWYRALTQSGGATQADMGLYVYPQYYLGSNVHLGVRFDYFSNLNARDQLTGGNLRSGEMAFVPTVTYQSSEFATFRLAYTHKPQFLGNVTTTNHIVELQGIFIIGAHPAHDF